ncbi:hypothetical protein CKAH01_03617 [Colletotrichum kahawae]|uniref:Uncharacterized protein n=1 Tax=Colletotrichum kahawae TaxID=34407 RepID=A0AAE0DA61_COLKA|nr:hypothetical protein CKAH01_03617 [Colletotrichum kahawae]
MKLTIPQGPCHPVVGGTYDEQHKKQLSRVTKLIAGSQPLPPLPRVGTLSLKDWDALRSRPTASTKSQVTSQGPQNAEQTINCEGYLVRLLEINYEGATKLISELWSDDARNIARLAGTSKALQAAVGVNVSQFHLPSRDFNLCDFTEYSLVSMAMAKKQENTLHKHLVVVGKDLLAPTAPITGIPKLWESDEIRDGMWAKAESLRATFAMTILLWPYYAAESRLSAMERRLSDKQARLGQMAVRTPTHHHLREATCAIPLLRSLHKYGANLTCVRLLEVPGLDLRVTKLILSACRSLNKLDIIECELLHFSSIVPLLDIVHVNSKEAGKSPVQLQFRPKTWLGTDTSRQGTMVISFDDIEYRNIPSAVMTTVFMAVIKAVPMGIDLVSENRDFRKFLDIIPMQPGAMALFLHHLMVYVDLVQDPITWASLDRVTRNDLEDQVLLAICMTKLAHRKRDDYLQRTYECDTCGYELITAFFRGEMSTRAPDQRTCRTCELHQRLDGQPHHRLLEKREMVKDLLFNRDEHVTKENNISTLNIPANDLRNVFAPTLPNPFVADPAANSAHRELAFLWHYRLPTVEALVSPKREYDILRASGNAALLDVVDEIAALDGLYPDHPTLTRQRRANARGMKQTWEHHIWHEVGKEETADQKPAGFW